jgi:hypothetical protein
MSPDRATLFLMLVTLATPPHPATAAAAAATDKPPAATADAPADLLKRLAGSWDATMQMASQDGSPPVVLNGTEVDTLGGRGTWVVSDFRSQLEGHPFQGHAVLSLDPATGRLQRVWADSTSAAFWASEGTWDPAASKLTMWIESVDTLGEKVRWREETVLKNADTRTFTMYVPGPQSTEAAGVTIVYHRRADAVTRTAIGPVLAPPTQAHDLLRRDAGTWSAKFDDRREKSPGVGSDKATEVGTLCCGGLFLVTEITGEGRDAPYLGHRLVGYDPGRKKYISAQVDTTGGGMLLGEGEYDSVAGLLRLNLGAPRAPEAAARLRLVEDWKGREQRTATLVSVARDGTEKVALVTRYRRAR